MGEGARGQVQLQHLYSGFKFLRFTSIGFRVYSYAAKSSFRAYECVSRSLAVIACAKHIPRQAPPKWTCQ
jgi:hypothetical protein